MVHIPLDHCSLTLYQDIFQQSHRNYLPYSLFHQKNAKKMVMKGKRPPLPERFRDPTHRIDLVLLKAMGWCWTHDPAERPSARAVAALLEKELSSIEKESKAGEGENDSK